MNPGDEYMQEAYVEDDGTVFSCDCNGFHLGRGWLIGAIVFEGVGVTVLLVLLYHVYRILKGS